MGINFSSQGSTSGTPTAGLLGNMSVYKPPVAGPKLVSNPFGSPQSGIVGAINQTTGLSSASQNPNYGKVEGVLAPNNPSGAGTSAQNMSVAPTTALKKQTMQNTDGTTTTNEYHAPIAPATQTVPTYGQSVTDGNGVSGIAKFDPNTGQPLVNPNTPANTNQPGSTGNSATNFANNLNNTANSGNQTQNEQATQSGLLASGQATPLEQSYIDQVTEAKKMQNAGALGANANASLYTNDTPEQLYNNTVAAPDLAGRAGADNSLYGTFGNIYGDAATAGLTAANTIANRGEAAAASAYSGAQNQATRATGANEAAAGLTAPQQTSPTSGEYAPGSNEYLQNSGAAAGAGGLAAVGALGTQQQQGGTVQEQTGNQAQAQALTQQLTSTINQSGFNSVNGGITTQALNGIGQWINNQSGDPQYQNAYNLINEIASKYSNILNASGGTPTDVSTTSHNIINKLASGQSIQKVIGDLDANATQSINALKNASSTNAVSSPSQVNAGGYGFTQVNGKWVPA